MNLEKRGRAWRARVFVNGKSESKTFSTKAEAVAWGQLREVELVGARLPDKTVEDALIRYSNEIAPTHRGVRWEIVRCRLLARDLISKIKLTSLKAADIAEWRDRRLHGTGERPAVGPASVRRELTLLQSVIKFARCEWGWIQTDPFQGVTRPTPPPSRKRRITDDEIFRLCLALGYSEGIKPETISQRIALAFLFALETAMRSGEILGLTWGDIGDFAVRLKKTKNGDERYVPLSSKARAILTLLDKTKNSVFNINSAQRDALFRKARNNAKLENLHFHDSRAEAIWRLSKKLDVMELARVIGHRDLKSLMIYYNASPEELAAKLG